MTNEANDRFNCKKFVLQNQKERNGRNENPKQNKKTQKSKMKTNSNSITTINLRLL